MKVYNRALDRMTLAMAFAVKGETVKAAKMFSRAIQENDVKRAIATLEASNAQAHAFQVQASKAVKAKKVVKANDDLDMGPDEDLDALMDDGGDEGDDMDEGLDEGTDDMEEVEGAADDEDDEDVEFDGAEFAKVLAGMKKK